MKNLIKEILKEETEEIDKSILNFLKRRVRIDEKQLGDDEHPLIVTYVVFKVGDDYYMLNSFMSKKEQVRKILEMLYENDVIDLGEYNPNILDTNRQKVVKTIRYFINGINI